MNPTDEAPSRWMVFGLLWTAYLINYVDRQMAFTWFPVLRSDLGFRDPQLGLIGTIFLWCYSLCAPFGGRAGDRFARRVILPLSIAGWSLATIATAMCTSPAAFLVCRGAVGITEGFYFPAAVSVLVAVFGDALRGRAIAMHGTAQFAGIALGGWLGGFAADRWGWRAACLALGGFGILYSGVVGLSLRGLREKREETKPYALRDVRVSPCLAAIGGCFFLICAMLWMLYAWLPDDVHRRFSLDLASSGANATLVLQVCAMAGLLGGGALGDWGRRRWAAARAFLMAAGLAACAPFAWLCFAATSLPMLWVGEAGFGLFSGLMLSNVIAGAYDLVPESQHGITAGSMTLVGGVGGGLATVAAGYWSTGLMLWTGIASCAGAVILGVLAAGRFGREAAWVGGGSGRDALHAGQTNR